MEAVQDTGIAESAGGTVKLQHAMNPGGNNLRQHFSRILGLCLLIAAAAAVLWRIQLTSKVNSYLRHITAAKLPVNGAELNAWRAPLADGENGALLLTQAFAFKRSFPSTNRIEIKELLSITNYWSTEHRLLVENYLSANSDFLEKVRSALRSRTFRYPCDFSSGLATPLPHLKHLKETAMILGLQACNQALAGSHDEGFKSIELMLRLASTLDDEPSMLSALARASMIRMAAGVLEKNLSIGAPNELAMQQLQQTFADTSKTNLLRNALIGDRACSIPIFQLSLKEAGAILTKSDGDEPEPSPSLPNEAVWIVRATGFFERDLNFYLQVMEKILSLASEPMPGRLQITNVCAQAEKTAAGNYYFFSSLILPSFSKAILHDAESQACSGLAQAALGLERFRLQHGSLPVMLADAAPCMPSHSMDPFTGKPFLYRRTSKGYMLHITGWDGMDDGGRRAPDIKKARDSSGYDLVFAVER